MARRLDKAALFEMLGYEPHPGQLAIHKSHAPRRVVASGVRFGKTVAGAYEAVAALMQPCASSIGWIVGPNYSHANRIFEHVVAIVQTRLPHRVLEMNPREHKLVVCNLGAGRSEMRAKTADNSAGLLGEGLNWLIVDEAARLAETTWTSHLAQRLIDRRGWSLLLSTPRGVDNWFYREFKRGQKNRDASYESWAMPSSANPHLDKELIEAERSRLDADVFAQEFEAQFIGAMRDPCDVCHGPRPDLPGHVVIRGHGEPPKCPECGLAVDEQGESVVGLGPDGKHYLTVINLILRGENVVIEDFPEDPNDPAPRLGGNASDLTLISERPRVDRDFFRSQAAS